MCNTLAEKYNSVMELAVLFIDGAASRKDTWESFDLIDTPEARDDREKPRDNDAVFLGGHFSVPDSGQRLNVLHIIFRSS